MKINRDSLNKPVNNSFYWWVFYFINYKHLANPKIGSTFAQYKKLNSMNAKEAREKTEQYIKNDINEQYFKVKEEIDKTVKSKKFKCNHYGILRPEVAEILTREGFNLTLQNGRPGDNPDTIISW